MERLNIAKEAIILDRNNKYLDNISTEHRPIILDAEDSIRLDNCIFEATEDVFDIATEQMLEGAKYKDEVRARMGAAETFRRLTSYSRWEIGQKIGVSGSAVGEYLLSSKKMLDTDIFFSAFVLTSVIKAYGKFNPDASIPINTEDIIESAKSVDGLLPVIR